MFLELLGDQVAHGNVDLLFLCVARNCDQLHAVQESRRNGGHGVSSGDEQYLGQVKRRVQVTRIRLRMAIGKLP